MNSPKKCSWSKEEEEWLIENYPKIGKMACAKALGLREGAIRARASKLGLRLDRSGDFFKDFQKRAASSKVGKKRPDQSILMKELFRTGKLNSDHLRTEEGRARNSKRTKEYIKKNGHPRGFLGGKHGEGARIAMSIASKKTWGNITKEKLVKRKKAAFKTRLKNRKTCLSQNTYSRGLKGKREDLDNVFFRSKAEANFARYIKHCLCLKYEYESHTFWFEGIRSGCTSYTPDFYIPEKDFFFELKGWLDSKSKTKLKRFKKYFPEQFGKMILVKQSLTSNAKKELLEIGFKENAIIDYKDIMAKASSIPGWEK